MDISILMYTAHGPLALLPGSNEAGISSSSNSSVCEARWPWFKF